MTDHTWVDVPLIAEACKHLGVPPAMVPVTISQCTTCGCTRAVVKPLLGGVAKELYALKGRTGFTPPPCK